VFSLAASFSSAVAAKNIMRLKSGAGALFDLKVNGTKRKRPDFGAYCNTPKRQRASAAVMMFGALGWVQV